MSSSRTSRPRRHLTAASLALLAAALTAATTSTVSTAIADDLPGSASAGSSGSLPGSLGSSGSSGSSGSLPGSSDAGSGTPTTNDGLYEGHVDVSDEPADDQSTFTGRVFDDANRNSVLDDGEQPVAGVPVSNGVDVTTTDEEGRYELPAGDNVTLSVTQPAGWQVPVDADNFAQFSYNHLPEGSTDLRFGGLEPTGDVPAAVNFPMAKSDATAAKDQSCPVAADTQTYDREEVGYAAKGAPADLAQRDDYAGCGVMLLGDNVGDDLSLNPDLRSLYRNMNGPVRALPGNHDMDYDATDDSHATDTYRQAFGATHYSYNVGDTHFIALDNIEYKGAKPDGSKNGYLEKIGADQLTWLKNDLAQVDPETQVVVYAHAPIVNYRELITDDALAFYDAVATHPNLVTVGGHTHTLEHLLAGERRQEWTDAGLPELPYDQIVAGAVSGDWYSGGLNDNGVPHAYTSDAAEPGVYTLSFSGDAPGTYSGRYTVRGEPQDHQQLIGVNSPTWREWAGEAQLWQDNDKVGDAPAPIDPLSVPAADLTDGQSFLTSSFFGGSTRATVSVSFDGGDAVDARITQPATGEAENKGWEFTDPISATENLTTSGNVAQSSPHLWRVALPGDLTPGQHTARVTATDRDGTVYTETVAFTVE
ncbi:calcineurin-like phosphoesterase family protein [uncultured Corynebacterium sp.]|uniref:calcineurin-like phosphoesterase family protein n=1 Tax=uncultured Corynebacterium sp. TaxID=159447 RepID=UPI0025E9E992|nr:calcineurin-like phosphoesterase family protein [uncultured Corynebacterium sp.]